MPLQVAQCAALQDESRVLKEKFKFAEHDNSNLQKQHDSTVKELAEVREKASTEKVRESLATCGLLSLPL